MEIQFLGHSCFALIEGDTTVLIDPFLTGNPKAAIAADDVAATDILVTHGHGDHVGDTVAIAKRTGATVTAIVELANEIAAEGVKVKDPNLGGTVKFDWGSVKLVPAWHTSTTPKGTVNTPAGLLINFKDTIVYHLGDTCLFSDLQLVGKRSPIDYALMCIGGHYTMDRVDAVDAAKLVGAKAVIPCHYDTFPPIETDVQAFKSDAESAAGTQVIVLEPGDVHATTLAGAAI
jgi:L-ascorbate metabolism protein UlaG (beta-lactamase superfamily)